MMSKRYVLYSDEAGVYLGSCMGLGFWSRLDPAGQTHAVTFENQQALEEWKKTLDNPDSLPSHRLVEVWPSNGNYATVEDCANAQLPRWDPNV